MKNTIYAHDSAFTCVSIFPSGNIISVFYDKTIKIYDNDFNILQCIQEGHDDKIIFVDIKDDNYFATCSLDKSIKTWIKKENEFELSNHIKNAHKNYISKIIYSSNGNLISCSVDSTIKIWEKINNNYQLLTTLIQSNCIMTILLLEDKNILVSSGEGGTEFWKIYDNILNIYWIYNFEKVIGTCWNAINRVDEDRIIIGGKDSLFVISINQIIIIKDIKIPFRCNGIKTINNKGIFLVGGWENFFILYNSENY